MIHALKFPLLALLLISVYSLTSNIFADDLQNQPASDIKITQLNNGIPLALIKKADALDSKIAVYVKAGHLYNSDTQGLPHLLEHLFNVNGNLDDSSNIEAILSVYGGRRKASTDTTGTIYWYQLGADGTQVLLNKLAVALSTPNISEQAITSQLAAIENEWLKGQQYQDLNEWEQEFSEFAKDPAWLNQPRFFVGNKDSLSVKDIKDKILEFHQQNYRPENIRIIISSPLSHQKMIQLANDTLGKITFPDRSNAAAPSLKFQSKVELFERPQLQQNAISLHYALPVEQSILPYQWQYLNELLNEKGKGSFTEKIQQKFSTAVNSAQLDLNYYDNRHRLKIDFQSPLKPAKESIALAEKLDAALQGFIDWTIHSADFKSGFTAFLAEAEQRCKGHSFDIDKNTASELSNRIFFIPLSKAVSPCTLSQPAEKPEHLLNSIIGASRYVSISTPVLEKSNEHPIKKMAFYPRRYQTFQLQRLPAIPDQYQFPEQNLWLSLLDKNTADMQSVNWLENLSEPVAELTLPLPTKPIENYVEAQWLKAYLAEYLHQELRDAEKLAITVDFLIDDALRIRIAGEQTLTSRVYLKIKDTLSDSQFDKALFLRARSQLLEEARAWSDKPQVNRTNEFITRLFNQQTWSDAAFISTVESLSENRAKEFLEKLPAVSDSPPLKPINLNGQAFTMQSEESVNTLTSLRLMHQFDLKTRLYAAAINALFKVEYKNEFRNRRKIAYIAITDAHLSKYGSGLLTLLQTSSYPLDRMEAMNSQFFKDMYKKLQQMDDKELAALFVSAKTDLKLKQQQPRYQLDNPDINIFSNRQFDEVNLGKTELLEFAEELLFDNQYLARIEVNGKNVQLSTIQ